MDERPQIQIVDETDAKQLCRGLPGFMSKASSSTSASSNTAAKSERSFDDFFGPNLMKKLNLFSFEADKADKPSFLGVPQSRAKSKRSPQAKKFYKIQKVTEAVDKAARAKHIDQKVNQATENINRTIKDARFLLKSY